jgi:hypothetical protein
MAYLSRQRGPRDLGSFTDDEHKHSLRKYLLEDMYVCVLLVCVFRYAISDFFDLLALYCLPNISMKLRFELKFWKRFQK